MGGTTKVDPALLPSHRDLHRALFGAILVAAAISVCVVLPAEEGIDPTGVGSILGLTAMGQLKNPPPAEVAPEPVIAEPEYVFRTDEMSLTLQPKQGTEIKAVMRAGDQLAYAWTADSGELLFDFHGEPKGAAPEVFTSYEKGTQSAAKGTFEAPFEGIHGWYWKNNSSQPIDVHLKTTGIYADISRK